MSTNKEKNIKKSIAKMKNINYNIRKKIKRNQNENQK